MDFITVPAVMLIITYGVYSLFELYARRKERIMLIEKMSQGIDPDKLTGGMSPIYSSNRSFVSLKAGFLLAGLGLGMVVALFIIRAVLLPGYMEDINFQSYEVLNMVNEMRSVIYGSCLLLFGGIGLLAAFLVENSMRKRQQK